MFHGRPRRAGRRPWSGSARAGWSVVALVLSSVLGTGGVAGAPGCPSSPYRSARTQIIAHASGDWFGPPNTIEMQRAATAAGADVLDADVRTTRDGTLVASHDDTIHVDATHSVSIAKTDYATLRGVDLGNMWPGPKGDHPLAGRHVAVPTIETMLRAFPHVRFGLEFKTTGGEATMCTLLRRLGRTGDVFVSSAGDAAVDRFKVLCPEVTTTVTDAMVPQFQEAQRTNAPWCAPVPIGQPPLREGTFVLTRHDVQWEHDHGLAVFTWTADTATSLQQVASLGVDGVYTARPDLARKLLPR